jgi:hypothetical protein
MWLTLFKAALAAGLVIGLTVLIIAGARRSRANRANPNWFRRPGGQPGHVASLRGAMPDTPLPEWIDWHDEADPDRDERKN